MRTKQKGQAKTTTWLTVATGNRHAHLTLRLPKRWVLGGMLLVITWWGGPEVAQLFIRLL